MNDNLKTNPSLDEITQKEINAQINQQPTGTPKKKHILGKALIGVGSVIATPILAAGYVGKRVYNHIKYKDRKTKEQRSAIGKIVTTGKVGLLSLMICYPGTTIKTLHDTKNYVIDQGKKTWIRLTAPPDYKEKAKQTEQELKKTREETKKALDAKEKEKNDLLKKLEKETGQKWEFKSKYESALKQPSKKETNPAYVSVNESEEQTLRPYINKNNSASEGILGVFVQKKGTTLTEIARDYTGDVSNWKKLAEYNNLPIENTANGPRVEILMGDLVKIQQEYASQAGLNSFENGKEPKDSIVRKRGETLSQAMERNSISLDLMGDIINYNHEIMPDIRIGEQERFWLPNNIEAKVSVQRTIREYPSRYNPTAKKIER